MTAKHACPYCAEELSVPPDLAGEVLSCPRCQADFVTTAPSSAAAEVEPETPRRWAVWVLLAGTLPGWLLVVFLLAGPMGDDSKEAMARAGAINVAKALTVYRADHRGERPAILLLLTQRDGQGNGPDIDEDGLLDPWGNPYQVDYQGSHSGGESPDVWTNTPDGKIVGNWQKR